MAPERSPKRQKTSESTSDAVHTPEPAQIPLPADTPVPKPANGNGTKKAGSQQSSWYASWSSKAPPVTQVASESIKAVSNATSEVIAKVPSSIKSRSVRSPSLAMTLGKKQSSRALPADASTTLVHVTSAGSSSSKENMSKNEESKQAEVSQAKKEDPVVDPVKDGAATTDDKQDAPSTTDAKDELKQGEQSNMQASRVGWLGWLGANETPQTAEVSNTADSTSTSEQNDQPKPEPIPENTPIASEQPETQASTVRKGKTVRRSWIPWGPEEDAQPPSAKVMSVEESSSKDVQPDHAGARTQEAPQKSSKPPSLETSPPPNLPHDASKASGWAFWSRDRNVTGSTASVDKPHNGEMAISDTPSQAKPEKASITLKESAKKSGDPPKPEKASTTMKERDKKVNESPKPESIAEEMTAKKSEDVNIKQHKKADSTTLKAESSTAAAVAQEPVEDKKPASIRSSKTYKNLLLPELQNTLKLSEDPSIVQRLARLLHITRDPDMQHLSLVKDPPRIQSALAIGVHGFFPAPLLRTVLGQPTGTSIKFADMAAKSIKRWTASRGYNCQVKTAALEGEGKIAERLELLWKLLINWIDEISKADFVLVACHSQGVPVAIMLVAKLIQFGCVNSARIGICAMAGVNMGPFAEYQSRYIGGSAGELFEFSRPNSRVSTDYLAALETVLKIGVRTTFVGSIDDQLVSLDSSIFSPISHPHIYRAVSIDAEVHAPNFLSHLVGFILKLRNLGVQDHGLIRELSPPLAGSLYTGAGHSRIYEDDAVYDLAVAFALETNSMVGVPLKQRSVASGAGNPYILPFAMRGILEEDFVKNELQGEASELLKQFDEWKPTTKVLKDVKFRLEGIRSKL